VIWTAVSVLLVIDLVCLIWLLHLAATAPLRDDWRDE